MVLILFSAVLTALAMPGMLWGYLIWVALIPFFIAMKEVTPLKGALRAFVWGLVYLLITHYWELPVLAVNVPEVLNSFPNFIGIVVYFLMGPVIAIPFLAFGFVYGLYQRFFDRYPVLLGLFAASFFTVVEYLREIGPLGFTNGRLSDALLNGQQGISQLLAFGGPLLLVFIIVFVNHYLSHLYLERTRDRAVLIIVSVALIALVNSIMSSFIPIPHSSNKYESTIYALQTNISMQMKYYQPPEETLRIVSRALREIPEGSLVVLPEATFMSDIRSSSTGSQLEEIARERDLKILVGFPTYNDYNFNQVRLVNSEGFSEEFYAKVQLTPFVEFLPWPRVFGVFSFLKFLDYFDPGEEYTIFSVDEHRIGAQICFDSLYSNVARRLTQNGANVIVTATNDGWFDISTALQQHLSKSIARAIENRRYVIQVSNSGISAVIDPYGRIVKRLPSSKELSAEYVIGEFQYLPRVTTTPYTRFGNWFFWFSLLLGIALIILGGVVL
ncbi:MULTISPECIES: apolipoprotein N-acyltransferase [unclassified Mesotoga]|uniref:apolipoprotein N-acyltransferase n=1 Tax=unclassified Mesotoga TaxID=1184398 RepID=UPI000DA6B450|nr:MULTISPECIES: apolipoprotein N-acyltransferase [unclassified Mesotoga]PZC52238.1 acyltransferase [Mesotoga sp. TolDC]